MANDSPNQKGLKKFTKLNRDRSVKAGRKGGKKSQEVQKEKKQEEKEKQKFADILNIILETETKDANIKEIIKNKYPNLKPDNKTLISLEHFQRMFKKNKEKVEKTREGGTIITKIKGMSDKDFLNFEEYMRDSIGEKPVDNVNQTNVNIEIIDKKVIDEVVKKLKSL